MLDLYINKFAGIISLVKTFCEIIGELMDEAREGVCVCETHSDSERERENARAQHFLPLFSFAEHLIHASSCIHGGIIW